MRTQRDPRHPGRRASSTTLALIALWLLALAARPASAQPRLDLAWDSCAGPVNRTPGAGPVQSLFVSATGLGGPTQAFDLTLRLRSLGGGLADAWRFDLNGCAAVHWSAVLGASSPACPALSMHSPLTLSAFTYATEGTRGAGILHFVATSNPPALPTGGRDLLVRFDFDEGAATLGPGSTAQTCGCLDRPMCIELASGSYLDAVGQEAYFVANRNYVTWNDANNSTYCGSAADCWDPAGCQFDSTCVAPVAARPASWGLVKGIYRMRAR